MSLNRMWTNFLTRLQVPNRRQVKNRRNHAQKSSKPAPEQLEQRLVLDSTQAWSNPLSITLPYGSQVYTTNEVPSSLTVEPETDTFTVALEANQRISVHFRTEAADLVARISLVDPDDNVIATTDASAAGQDLVLQTVALGVTGTYSLRVQNLAGSGDYTLELTTAGVEVEAVSGTSNNTRETAQNLDPFSVNVLTGGSVLSVTGNLSSSSDTDFFSVTLTAGTYNTITLYDTNWSQQVALLDAAGNEIFPLGTNSNDANAIIPSFIVPVTGTYYVRTTGYTDSTYYLTVARGVDVDLENNNSTDLAQPLYTGQAIGHLSYSAPYYDYYDYYEINLTEGDDIVLETTTPRDVAGEPQSNLNPEIYLYDSNGSWITYDQNSATDGRNARLTYTVPTGATGTYYAMVYAASGYGAYTLSLTGNTTAPESALVIVDSSPMDGQLLSYVPNYFTIEFSIPVSPGSIALQDIEVNGINPTSFYLYNNGRSIEFYVADLDVDNGDVTISIPAGAITAFSGASSPEFNVTFTVDSTGPTVVSTNLGPGGVLPTGTQSLVLQFSEDISQDYLENNDWTLTNSQGQEFESNDFVYDENTFSLTINYSGLNPGEYTFELLSDFYSIKDLAGNYLDGSGDGGDDNYLLNFSIDVETTALLPLTRLNPFGSLLHQGVQPGSLHEASDTDSFTVDLQAGQNIALVLNVAPGLSGTIEVFAPGGASLGSATSAAAGQAAELPSIAATTTGTYTFRVSSGGGTGAYTLSTLLNGQFEAETVTGTTNNTLLTAESLHPSQITLPGGANRLAAFGGVTDVPDFYSFTLTAGQGTSLVLTKLQSGPGGLRLELLNSAGDLLALGGANAEGSAVAIHNFTATQTGTYYARVVSTTVALENYDLVVTRGASFDWEPNTEAEDAQILGSHGVVLGAVGGGSGGSETSGGNVSMTYTMFDGAAFRWDITGDGSISDGSNDAFDGGIDLTSFSFDPQGQLEGNGREVLLGPSQSGNVSLTRKIYVPTDGNFARFFDSMTNTSGTALTFTFSIYTNLGSDGFEPFVSTSSGDGTFTTADNWIVTDDSAGTGDPAVGHIIAGPNGALRPSYTLKSSGAVEYRFEVPLAPGETRSILHFSTQNYNQMTAVGTAALLETLPEEALAYLSGAELNRIANFAVESEDQYLFDAAAGSNLVISTSTPVEGTSANLLDPVVELYDPDGVLVASDDNSAVDGRNALLNYTVPAGEGGTYRVLIRGAASSGSYVLQVSGASTTQQPLVASAVNPADGAFLTVFPATYRLSFNQELLLSSLQASDLRVNGTAVSSFAIIDGRTLELDLTSHYTGDGVYTITIAPSALTSLAGTTNEFFSATFDVDATNPTVVASSIHTGDTIESGSLTYQVQFSEPINTTGLTADDVTVVNTSTSVAYSAQSFAYDPETRTLTLTFDGLEEGVYNLTLISGADGFRDLRGNLLDGTPSFPLPSGDGGATGNFLVNFNVDTGTRAFITPLMASPPLGSLVYDGSMSGFITPAADTDAYTLAIEAGQLVSVVVQPGVTLLPVVELLNSSGTVIATGTASAAGQPAVISALAIPTGGNYRIVVRGDGLTTGSYAVQAVLNALLETESVTGTSNNSRETAQDLGPSLLNLTDGVSRQAVIGTSHNDDDFYRVSLQAGEYISVAVAVRTGTITRLELHDENGTVLAVGTQDESTNQLQIANFRADGGQYYLVTRGSGNAIYNLAVLRGVNLDAEPNDDVNHPQRLEGPLRALGTVQGNSNFTADFSDSAGLLSLDGFTATGLWHVTNQAGGSLPGHTSPNMAYFGDDASENFNFGRVFGTLTSPPLSLRSDVAGQLSMKYRLQGESSSSWDRAEVRVSTNNGESYTTIATKSSHFGQTLSWTEKIIDLSAFAGQTILLQFSFDSGDGVSNEGLGWQIDDLVVTGVTDQQDHYSFQANAGDVLVLSTTTPGDAEGEPQNPFDIILDLYDPSGNLVATDDNSSIDGHNAVINYTAVAAGQYTVRVRGNQGGAYQLSVQGSSASNTFAPRVDSAIPENGAPLAEAPDSLTLIFSEAIRADSVNLEDLVFSTPGVTVTGVTQVDGHTLRFDLSIPDASGLYEYSLAAGAVLDLQAQGNEAFSGSIFVDRLGPMVTSTNPAFQTSSPFTEVTFTFNEALDRNSVSTADVTSFTGPGGVNLLSAIHTVIVNGNQVTFQFNQQLTAGNYSMTLGPNILDMVGNQLDQNQDGTPDSYTLTLEMQSPDLRVDSVTGPSSALFGQQVSVTYVVSNIGADPALESWYDAVYLSTDAFLDRDDVSLQIVPALGLQGPLDATGGANDSYERTINVQLPLNFSSATGTYYLLVSADYTRRQPESSESNNVGASTALTVSLPPMPDLVVSQITAPAGALSGQEIDITWTITNQGTGEFSGVLRDYLYLSNNATVGSDQYFSSVSGEVTIPVGGTLTRTQRITLPIAMEGAQYVVITTEGANSAYEHQPGESNNTSIDDVPINVQLAPYPNLRVTSVTAPPTAFSSQQTVIEWVVTNVGNGPTNSPVWYDQVFLSTDDVLDDQDLLMGYATNASYLNSGESYSSSLAVTLPRGITGPYRFIVKADGYNYVYEYTFDNDNARTGSTTNVQLTPPPDLQVTNVAAPAQAFSGQPMNLSWTISNLGTGKTLETAWYDFIYLSTDAEFGGDDVYLGQFYHSGVLEADEFYTVSNASVKLPIGITGDYYIFVRTDAYSQVYEHASEGNNIGLDEAPVRINLTPPPDLLVASVQAPAAALANHQLVVNYTVANEGATETPNSYWEDRLYLSTDQTFDPGTDLYMANRGHYGVLNAGDTYNSSFTVTLPPTLSGVYYAFVMTDVGQLVFELDRTNNVGLDTGPLTIEFRPPDLVVNEFVGPATANSGSTILVNLLVQNIGTGDTVATSWFDHVYLSSDSIIGNGDDLSLGNIAHTGLLGESQTYSGTNLPVTIPLTVPSGNYFLYLVTDNSGHVFEHENEGNNTSVLSPITITQLIADLQVTAASVTPTSQESGGSISVSWTVSNQGAAVTNVSYWDDTVILSSDDILGNGDDIHLQTVQHNGSLAFGQEYSVTRNITLPQEFQGTYHVYVIADSGQRVVEGALESNNTRAALDPLVVTLRPAPDLQVTNVDAPSTASAGQLMDVSWTVTNAGTGTPVTNWYDSIYLSLDQSFDSSDTYLGYAYRPNNLAPGNSYTQTLPFRIPQGLAGAFYVFVKTDAGNNIVERTMESNNVGYDVSVMNVALLPPADLVVGTITVPANGVPGKNVTVTYTVENQGQNAANGSWTDTLYLSLDNQWSVNDLLLGQVNISGNVPGGSSYTRTLTAPAPGVNPGDYHIIVRSDIRNTLPEINDGNNLKASLDSVDFDAEVLTLDVPAEDDLLGGRAAYYKIVLPAGETVRFTLESESEDSDTELYVRYGSMPSRSQFDFAANEPFEADQQLTIPADQAGTYYVLVYRRSAPSNAAGYSLEANLVPFSISNVTSRNVGNLGPVTFKIDGARFNQGTYFELIGPTGNVILAQQSGVENSVRAYATFDLSYEPVGNYTFRATQGSSVTTMTNAVVVSEGEGANIITDIAGADQVRPDRSYTFQLLYANEGDSDTESPLILMRSRSGTPIATNASDLASGSTLIQILGLVSDGPATIFRPGVQEGFFFNFQSHSVAQGVDIQAFPVSAKDGRIITDEEWLALESSARPSGLSNDAWSSFWANIRTRIGTTWGEYVLFLNRTAELLDVTGQASRDVKAMMAVLYADHPDFRASTRVSGTLRDAETGAAVQNVEIGLFEVVPGTENLRLVAQTVTDSMGNYLLGGLFVGQYVFVVGDDTANTMLLSFDNNRDGIDDPEAPVLDVEVGPDVVGHDLWVRRTPDLLGLQSDVQPQVVTDSAGNVHLFWVRASRIWHARHDGSGWVDAQMLPDSFGADYTAAASANLIDGTTAGLIVMWSERGAEDNETEIRYSVGRFTVDGQVEWSDPEQMTDNEIADLTPSMTVDANGEVTAVYERVDESQTDDSDLYQSSFEVHSSNLTFTPLAMAGAGLGAESVSGSWQFGYSFKAGGHSGGLLGKLAKIDFKFRAGGSYSAAKMLDLQASGSLDFSPGETELGPGKVKSKVVASFSYKGKWQAQGTKDNCEYVFVNGKLKVDGGGELEYEVPLEWFISKAPPVVGLPGTILLVWMRRAKLLQVDLGFGIRVTVQGEFHWTSPDGPPVDNRLPDSGNGYVTITGGLFGKAKGSLLKGWEIKAYGAVTGRYQFYPKTGWDQHPSGFLGVDFTSPSGYIIRLRTTADDLTEFGEPGMLIDPLGGETEVELIYDPELLLGLGMDYSDASGAALFSSVTTDLTQDFAPSIWTAPNGQRYLSWAKNVDPNSGDIGSTIQISTQVGGVWTSPVTIPGSLGYSNNPIMSFDASGRPVVVWSQGDSSTEVTEENFVDALENSDLYYSVLIDGNWTTAGLVTPTEGEDHDAAIGVAPDGSLVVAWHNIDGDNHHLWTSQWSGTAWSAPVQVTGADVLSKPTFATLGGQLNLIWSQDTNSDPALTVGGLFASVYSTGTWSTPSSLIPVLSSSYAASLTASDVFGSIQTTAAPFGLKPDPKYCPCDKINEKTSGTNQGCGSYTEYDEKTCTRTTVYKPCVVVPRDPNDIVNPAGYGDEHWITADDKIDYLVRFENAADASAPAQSVTITQTLDPDLNPSSFRLGSFGFDNQTFEVPENRAFYTTRLDLTETRGYFVDVVMGIDISTRQAFWTLTTIDPETGEQPLDANVGFLPVNDETGQGEGFVSYSIRARSTVTTGTRIDAGYVDDDNDFRASIVFDTEGPILTPSVFNTLDAEAPESAVIALPANVESETFQVSWSATDPNNGSGVGTFDIFVSVDGDEYSLWLDNTDQTSAFYAGEVGRTYAFYSVASDNTGNEEEAPATYDTITVTPGGAATVGNYVWHDSDGDGIQDQGETGLEGVTVNLYLAADDSLLATTVTAANGSYSFPGLDLGNQYYLEFITLAGYGISPPDQTLDDNLDSDASITTGRTPAFNVVNGLVSKWDAGMFLLGSISGKLFEDVDADGTQDLDEVVLEGWRVYLDTNDNGVYDPDLNEPTQLTDANGLYTISGLRPGMYIVAQVVPAGWEQTFPGPAGSSGTNNTGFRQTYHFSGSTTELTTPTEVVVDLGLSTADCGCGGSSNSTTSNGNGTVPGETISNGSYHPWADLIELDAYRNDPEFAGIDGTGSTVVIIDTGIDVNHSFFGPDNDGDGVADRIIFQWDFADRDGDASDRTGHGSHVSSVVGSQDSRYAGIAPGVNIISLKVFGDNGRGYFSYVEQALGWVIENASMYNIVAINMSIGDGQNWSSAMVMQGLGDELATLADMDIATVAAAGNSYAVYGSQGLAYPAADPNTISVGAVWDGDRGGPWSFGSLGTDYTTGADRITSFSQRDANDLDLFAPGAVIGGANATGGTSWLRGTSMATPQVTGAIVLGQQIAEQTLGRRLSNFELRSLLRSSGVMVVDGDDENDSVNNTGITSYRLDVHAFAQAVLAYDGTLVEDTTPEDPTDPGTTDPGPQTGRPYRFTVTLAAEQNRTDVNFGSRVPDLIDPSSSVAPLAAFGDATFTVEWSGSDDIGGSGLASYNVYVSDNNGPYILWKDHTTDTSGEYTGVDGHTYAFYSVAIDRQNNMEAAPLLPDAVTTVDLSAPSSSVTALPAFSLDMFTVFWTGNDGPGSGVASYDIYVSVDGGAFSLWLDDTTDLSATYTGAAGSLYAFYSVATDNRGFVEVDAGVADTSTRVDITAPTSIFGALPTSSPGTLNVEWSGSDGTGSGIASYDIYVSDNGGTYELWLENVTGTSATFTGVDGHMYSFYSVAMDNAGNTEAAPMVADAMTTVDAVAPTSSVQTLPAFSAASFLVEWSGTDGTGTGITGYDIYVSVNGAAFTLWLNDTTDLSATYNGVDTATYAFYSIATDNVGNVEAPPALFDATTEVDITAPTSSVSGLPNFSLASFAVIWVGSDGEGSGIASYDIYVSDNGGAYTLWLDDTALTTANYTGVDGHTYAFYSVATDFRGQTEAAPVTADATTTVDDSAPSSSVTALPAFRSGTFAVNWTGTDGTGSGIASYDIYVSDNGGAWTLWLDNTTETTANYTGVDGHNYGFYSVVVDQLGLTEAAPATADTSTTVDTSAPTSSVHALSAFSPASFLVEWSGTDGTGSGIAAYDIYVSINGGAFALWQAAVNTASATYTNGQDGDTYAFYSVAVDHIGNYESSPPLFDTTTEVDITPPTSSVSALANFSSATFTVNWTGNDGIGSGIQNYDIYVSDNGGTYTLWLSATEDTSAEFTGVDGHTYAFYSIARDFRGLVESTPAMADSSTTVDISAPTSSVNAPAAYSLESFTVSWAGSDGAAGSGISSYDIYVSDNGGPWTLWRDNTTLTADNYAGVAGHTYGFYSVATDNRGNTEAAPASADASTTIDTTAPTSSVNALPTFSLATFAVNWTGADGSGSGVASYDIYVSDNGGTYTLWLDNTTSTSSNYTGANGHTYRFYSVAVDNLGNTESDPGTPDASTTVDSAAPSSSVNALPTFSLATFAVNWTGNDGSGSGIASYDIYVSENGGTYTLWLDNTTATSANYTGEDDHTYSFYSVAVDTLGNTESVPVNADATTEVDSSAPSSAVSALAAERPEIFTLNWSGSDGSGSGIASYDIYVSDNGGAWALLHDNTPATSAQFTGVLGHTYGFYSVAVDQLGQTEAAPAVADTETTIINQTPDVLDDVFSLFENSPLASVVGTVSGSDPDPLDTVSFSIIDGNTDGAFAIHPTTGEITVANAAAIDFEAHPTFTLTVQITDVHGATDTATVEVTLVNVNESPSVLDDAFTVLENSAVGTVVGEADGSDPDAGDTLTYAILDGNTSGAFAINSSTGEITVANAAALDFETNPTFTLTVRTMDADGLSDTATITITLTDANDVPKLTLGGGSVTFSKKDAKKNGAPKVAPNLVVDDADQSPAFKLGGGTLTITTDFVAKVSKSGKRKDFDAIGGLSGANSLGTVTGPTYNNGKLTLTIQLNASTTAAQVQNFLRGITFSTKGAGAKEATRVLQAQVTDAAGAASNLLSQTINITK